MKKIKYFLILITLISLTACKKEETKEEKLNTNHFEFKFIEKDNEYYITIKPLTYDIEYVIIKMNFINKDNEIIYRQTESFEDLSWWQTYKFPLIIRQKLDEEVKYIFFEVTDGKIKK